MDALTFYSQIGRVYERYGAGTHSWHYGVWEPDVTSHPQALIRENELLLRDLPVNSSTHILDVGCGSGGFGVWAARRPRGARVTGITIVPEHVAMAAELAQAEGVGDRCRFLVMDMNALDFDEASFDVVVNQETSCYAADKGRYLASIHRVLRPGGWWRAVDFSVRDELRDASDQQRLRHVCDGFHLPSLAPPGAMSRLLQAAGFVRVEARDITPLVLKTANHIIRRSLPGIVSHYLGLDHLFPRTPPTERANRFGNAIAALHYSRGLQRGVFQHVYYAAQKPLAGS